DGIGHERAARSRTSTTMPRASLIDGGQVPDRQGGEASQLSWVCPPVSGGKVRCVPDRPSAAWERLGEMLVRRRLELDPRYRNRRTFARERDPRLYRLFSDIELGRRPSYKPASLAAIERAYELGPGAGGRFLSGGLESPDT